MALDTLSTTFGALADPTRRAILARLAEGPATVKELDGAVRDERPRDLEAPAGARARRTDHARPRGAVAPCRLEAAPLKEVAEWAENYRRFWDASFERLDAYLQHMKEQESKDGHGK